MTNGAAISVCDLRKAYRLYAHPRDMLVEAVTGRPWHREFVALDGISFDVEPGMVVGLMGRNGAGKSTLLRIIAGTLDATSGTMSTYGRIAAILELGTGFHPDYTGRENIYLGGLCLGLSRREIDRQLDEVIAFSELEDFIDRPFRTYSTGMQARLTFSVATSVDPDILIVDEALSVGDARFQLKSFDRIRDFKRRGKAILLVSHNINQIVAICDRAILLEKGRVHAMGDPNTVGHAYHELLFTPIQPDTTAHSVIDVTSSNENLEGTLAMGRSGTELTWDAERSGVELTEAAINTPVAVENLEASLKLESPQIERPIDIALACRNVEVALSSGPDIAGSTDTIECASVREHRYGNRAALITQIRLLDSGGREVRQLRSLEGYTLSVSIRARDLLTQWCLGVHVRDARGIELFGTDTFLFTGATLPKLSAKAELTVRMHFRATLAAGTYYFTVGLAHEDGTKYDMRLDAHEFAVEPTVKLYHASLVDLEACFEIIDPLRPNNVITHSAR